MAAFEHFLVFLWSIFTKSEPVRINNNRKVYFYWYKEEISDDDLQHFWILPCIRVTLYECITSENIDFLCKNFYLMSNTKCHKISTL